MYIGPLWSRSEIPRFSECVPARVDLRSNILPQLAPPPLVTVPQLFSTADHTVLLTLTCGSAEMQVSLPCRFGEDRYAEAGGHRQDFNWDIVQYGTECPSSSQTLEPLCLRN